MKELMYEHVDFLDGQIRKLEQFILRSLLIVISIFF